MNILKKLFFILIIFCSVGLFAQQNLSIPLTDDVYFLLENASLRGILPTLPAAKPYTLSFVLDNLNRILESDELSDSERVVFSKTYERLAQNEQKKWYETGYYTNRFDENVKLPITAGFTFSTLESINFNNPDLSQEYWGDIYIKGDITQFFSYNFNFGGSFIDLAYRSFPNNTYTKSWDGTQFIISDFYDYSSISDLPSCGLRLLPELVFNAFDSKVQVKFSRTPRDWGYGEGNLMLSGTARPFIAIETGFYPLSWLSTNFVSGTLEFAPDGSLSGDASNKFQNMFSSFQGEIKFEYFYLGLTSSVVFPKRIELGYMNPFILSFLYQNNVGNFDNVQLGVYGGITIPKITHIYTSIFMDEINFQGENIFNKDRNMYAVQLGAKSPLPFWSSVITLQYTKIEPYMYTHPLTKTPWYDKPMDTSYINHGQPLGYFLNPNSDEFKLQFEAKPLWYLSTKAIYSLVRHGVTSGSGKVDGSSFNDSINYADKDAYQNAQEGDLYWKDFLHDGVYEWINSVALGAVLDCRYWNVPITVGLTYTFSYTHHTLGDKNGFRNINTSEYSNKAGNYLTFSVKVFH